MGSYPYTQWRKTSDILTSSTLAAVLFSSHPKRERNREAYLNYYASAYNRGRQLSHRKTKLNQIGPTTKHQNKSQLRNTDNTKLTERTKPRFDRLLRSPAWKRSGDYSGRNGRDGQKKKIGKANEKSKNVKCKKSKRWEVNGQGREKAENGVPGPTRGANAVKVLRVPYITFIVAHYHSLGW